MRIRCALRISLPINSARRASACAATRACVTSTMRATMKAATKSRWWRRATAPFTPSRPLAFWKKQIVPPYWWSSALLPARPMWRPGERTTAAGAQPGCITKPFVNISAPSRCPGHDAKKPPLRTAGAFLPKRLNRKPGSVLNDDLSRLHVAMQLQPPPGTRRARIVPIWALLLVGFTEPRKSPSALVRSYRTFPPFPAQNAGSLFLLHYPWGHPRLPLAVTIPLWSPDFPQSA